MSAEILREAANQMREHASRGVAWHAAWDGDYAADQGWLAPVVALEIASWLDATAERIDAGRDPKDGGRRNHGWRGSREALAVARAYLGGDS